MINKNYFQASKKFFFQFYDKFKLLESKDLILAIGVLVFLFFVSLSFFIQTISVSNLVPKAAKAIEKKQIIKRRVELIESESKKNQSLEPIHRLFLEVFNTHLKKELEFVTQFQGFEKLRGHESKFFLEKYPINEFIKEKNVNVTKEYRETEYEISPSVFLSDLELKKLIFLIEDLKIKHPAFLITGLEFDKKIIDEKEKYHVNVTFVLREKIIF